MVIQTANIVTGFVLSAPRIKSLVGGAATHVEAAESKLNNFRGTIGVIELVLGIAALVESMGLVYFMIPSFGSSYPQAFFAIAMGLILCANFFEKYPAFHDKLHILKENAEWIGIGGIVVGLASIF